MALGGSMLCRVVWSRGLRPYWCLRARGNSRAARNGLTHHFPNGFRGRRPVSGRDAVGSQVTDVLEAQEIKEPVMKDVH
jgi:hypothetical protein